MLARSTGGNHRGDLGIAVAGLTQNRRRVLAQMRCGQPVGARTIGQRVGGCEVVDRAFSGVRALLDEPNVCEMRIIDQGFKRVIRRGGDVVL